MKQQKSLWEIGWKFEKAKYVSLLTIFTKEHVNCKVLNIDNFVLVGQQTDFALQCPVASLINYMYVIPKPHKLKSTKQIEAAKGFKKSYLPL